MAVAWSAIGMLGATLVGMFALFVSFQSSIVARIDEQGRSLGARIDELSGRIEEQGRNLGTRIDGLSARIDEQAARIDALAVALASHIQHHAS